MILLEVPFAEKDQAKALGARWNPAEKKWYIPDELEANQDLFAKWIYQPTHSKQSTQPEEAEKGISLSHLMTSVQRVLRTEFSGAVWVKAEIANLNERRGHWYFELTETNEQGQPIATCRAMIWQRQANAILTQFKQATGSDLSSGQKILLLAEVTFHEKFGFSLVIQDIDPAFTLGELEANLNQIRQQLIKEKIYELNKQLPPPLDFFRVAVIAPPAAAGLGDFRADADQLQALGLCEFNYFYSAFQGEQVESEMESAFHAFNAMNKAKPFDALVIIRGGGAKLDLNPLNNYLIAKQICEANIPVLTGIGHERDHTILDEVSNSCFDTPSKVIAGVRHTIFSRAQTAQNYWQQIEKLSQQYIQQQHHALAQLEQYIQKQATQSVHLWREKCLPLHYAIQQKSQQRISQEKQLITQQMQKIHTFMQRDLAIKKQEIKQYHEVVQQKPKVLIAQAKVQLEQTYRFIFSSGPQSQLNRGFVMSQTETGEMIKTAQQAQQQNQITLKFCDGDIQTKVIK